MATPGAGKLCADLDLKTARFADLDFFRNGLEGLIGIPPKPQEIRTAMEREHKSTDEFWPPLAEGKWPRGTTLSDEWGVLCVRAVFAGWRIAHQRGSVRTRGLAHACSQPRNARPRSCHCVMKRWRGGATAAHAQCARASAHLESLTPVC